MEGNIAVKMERIGTGEDNVFRFQHEMGAFIVNDGSPTIGVRIRIRPPYAEGRPESEHVGQDYVPLRPVDISKVGRHTDR